MDDPNDRGYSRAPEVEDLVALCRALNEAGARYLLIGGFAVLLHGAVRTTKDIDLLVDSTPENVRALKQALSVLPDDAVAEVADNDVAEYGVVRVADEIVVDLMARACGIDYAEAMRSGIERIRLGDVDIPVAGKELLIRTKNTFRDSDRADVTFLQARLEEERNRGR